MGITEILWRIWLFSANEIKKISESFSKQPTQLTIELNSSLRNIIVTNVSSKKYFWWKGYVGCTPIVFRLQGNNGKTQKLTNVSHCHMVNKVEQNEWIMQITHRSRDKLRCLANHCNEHKTKAHFFTRRMNTKYISLMFWG